jgi:hypothetical protein
MCIEAELCTHNTHIPLCERNRGTIQKLSFGVNPMIELKNVTTNFLDVGRVAQSV